MIVWDFSEKDLQEIEEKIKKKNKSSNGKIVLM